ncbi:MAG: dihydrolipoamide acyltransferase [Rhodocyclaceae bacterium]|nr:dihydrolipoamide acyltransferase [Rhodocyclaceae bacterium]
MVCPVKDVRIPKYPECWESCGSCASGEIFVQSVLVSVGERVARDDTLIVLETGKVALELPCPDDGEIVEVCVEENDPVDEGDLIVRVNTG